MLHKRAKEQFPAEPLIDLSELPEIIDNRQEVEHLWPFIKPDEVVVKVLNIDRIPQTNHPSAIKQLLRLTNVNRTEQMGERGPVVASLTFPENANELSLTKFESPYGRDALVTALLLKQRYPKLLAATLLHFARKQGIKFDAASGEEPGGIVHDDHDPADPIARKFSHYLNWKFPYYGTVDAVPLFVNGIYFARKYALEQNGASFLSESYTGKDKQGHNMLDALNQAIGWITRRLDQNPEGLLEYRHMATKGLDNQAWKDSYHAYVHKDGSLANHSGGIASVEVQGYAYDALTYAAEIYKHDLRDLKTAGELQNRAEDIRWAVFDKFWVDNESGGYFGLGTDRDAAGNLRLMEVRTSNMGHLLNSMLLNGDDPEMERMRRGVIRNLLSPEMMGAAGVRTLANDEIAFNPYGYHTGGIWPQDNAWIAAGFEKHGFYGAAWRLNKGIHTTVASNNCFPELVQGGDELTPELSTKCVYVWDKTNNLLYLLERAPQEIQAWVVAALLAAKIKNPLAGPRRAHLAMPKQAQNLSKLILENELLAKL